MFGGVSKRRKSQRDIPFDIFCNFLEFLESPRDYLSISLVSKGLVNHILQIRANSMRNIKFTLHRWPKTPQKIVKYLEIVSPDYGDKKSTLVLETCFGKISELFPSLGRMYLKLRTSRRTGFLRLDINPTLPHLNELVLKTCWNSNDDIEVTVDKNTCPWLETIIAEKIRISSLSELGEFKNLRKLKLENRQVHDFNVGFEKLKELKVGSWNRSSIPMEVDLRNLEVLQVNHRKNLKLGSNCTSLRILKIDQCDVGKRDSPFQLDLLPSLEDLSLELGEFYITLAQELRQLHTIGLSYVSGVLNIFSTPSLIKNLEKLKVYGCREETLVSIVTALSATNSFSKLKDIEYDCTSEFVPALKLPELRCAKIGSRAMNIVKCPKLESLEMTGSFQYEYEINEIPTLKKLKLHINSGSDFKKHAKRLKELKVYTEELIVHPPHKQDFRIPSHIIGSICDELVVLKCGRSHEESFYGDFDF